MSQYQPPAQNVYVVQNPSNGLGTAGFIVSLLGLFLTCGFLCHIGLLSSFFGLLKPPRGMAIAGVLLGLLDSWWLFAFGFVMVAALVAPAGQAAREAAREAAKAEPPPVVVAPPEPAPIVLEEPPVEPIPEAAPIPEPAASTLEPMPIPSPEPAVVTPPVESNPD